MHSNSDHYYRPLVVCIILLSAVIVQAHMQLYFPPPFAAKNNPHLTGAADPYLDYPYNCCGRKTPFPCRGYLNLLGTSQGAPVVTWAAGSVASFSLTGEGNHYGGSCQVGFSIDNGTSWKVVRSYEGNCPHRHGGIDPTLQTFEFNVPIDTPAGNHIFAWTWINREQEFNMVCSSVTITSNLGPQATSRTASTYKSPSRRSLDQYPGKVVERNTSTSASPFSVSVAFNDRPSFLIADIDNGCLTPKTSAEVKYPNPGPDVLIGDGEYPLDLPTPANKCGY
ncbi:hypothetical protein Egran_03513 [Elaphomyces granulatus]|uniref:Chitin-binding type-4 domain-containing protein n=1 Tax=Elaphomyces granulatus TaxID=519963 RepID=A0A232LXB4_9EURO|nr:hypothetical protein Egran_03513 [Elaphomyces granulatus]